MMPTEGRITEALSHAPFALIGAGQLGEMTLALWPADLERPAFVLDSVRRDPIGGIEVRPLQEHAPVPGATYLLSAFKMPADEVRGIFRALGQSSILTAYDLFEHTMPELFSNGWRDLSPSEATLQRLERLPGLYADDLSARICRSVEAWRYRRDLLSDYPVAPEADKYDLSLMGRGGMHYDVVYDCGSFDLGLLDSLRTAQVSFGSMIAFEPDPRNRARCVARINEMDSELAGRISVDPRALHDHAGVQPFVANGQLSARIVPDSLATHPDHISMECCTLDAVHAALPGESDRVLIKLHIEGSEPSALAGAMQLITETRSDVLINMSHDERSLLEIPDVLAATGRFDIFLRSHSLFGEGLTLFARHR
jgi:FkbM family methyltransferase